MRLITGRMAGMQAHMMPTFSSAQDQMVALVISWDKSFDILAV